MTQARHRLRTSSETPRAPFRLNKRLILGLAAIATLLAFVLVTPHWGADVGSTRRLSPDQGYKAAVDALARHDVFRVKVISGGYRPLPREVIEFSGNATGENVQKLGDCRSSAEKRLAIFYPNPGAKCASRLSEYYKRTYLKADMPLIQHWNVADNVVEGLDTKARVLAVSGGRPQIWRGTLNYREEPAARGDEYRPGEAMLLLADVAGRDTFFRFMDGRAPVSLPALSALQPQTVAGEGRVLNIALPSPGDSTRFGGSRISFTRLGRAVVVGLPPLLGDFRIYIDGRIASRDAKARGDNDDTDFVLLRPGQYLVMERSVARERRVLQLVETPGAISEFSGRRRLRETSLDNVSVWLEDSRVKGNFHASIIASLHHDLQRRLAAQMEAQAPVGAPLQSYRGAVLLMDGLTGEIAAAATFPTRVSQLSLRDRNDRKRLDWLRLNMNFEPLAVGSAAKVPFAAAIVERWPQLLTKTLTYNPSFSSVRGNTLRVKGKIKTLNNEPGQRTQLDFRGFLADSNNEYALSLMDEATILEKQRNGDAWRTPTAWPANLWKYACIIPYSLQGGAHDEGWPDAGCSPHLWRGDDERTAGDRPLSTDRVKLRMGIISNDYTDFYLSMLGGGRSFWATSNLGQAYARILSGRAVSPRLLKLETGFEAQSVPIRQQTWRAVTDGMQHVLTDGTAARLGERLASLQATHSNLYFFGKTGTSDVELPSRPTENGHLLVLAAAQTRSGKPPAGPNDICNLKIMVINLQRDKSSALSLASDLLDPARNPAYVTWLSQPCATTSSGGRS